jgi:hypothetical protein
VDGAGQGGGIALAERGREEGQHSIEVHAHFTDGGAKAGKGEVQSEALN